ncbi:MAG: PAS domain S-box protein [Bacteroidia bacterium]
MINKMVFANDSKMAKLILEKDWSQTLLGNILDWPLSLKSAVNICLNSKMPIVIWWGADLIGIYNDGYRDILGDKHPWALGAKGKDVWAEIWHIMAPLLEIQVFKQGKATWFENQLFFLNKNGYREERYFTFSQSPIHNEIGEIDGVFNIINERTQEVLDKRYTETAQLLAKQLSKEKSQDKIYKNAIAIIEKKLPNFFYTSIYTLENKGYNLKQIAVTSGFNESEFDKFIDLSKNTARVKSIQKVIDTKQLSVLNININIKNKEKQILSSTPSQLLIPILQKEEVVAILFIKIINNIKIVSFYIDFFKLVSEQISKEVTTLLFNQLEAAADVVITHKKLEESERRYNRLVQRYRDVVQGLPVAVFTCDAEGKIMLYNSKAVDLWGKEPKISQDKWHQFWKIYKINGAELTEYECALSKILRGVKTTVSENLLLENINGIRRIIKFYPQATFDNAGKIMGAVIMLIDITESQIAERKLRESEARFRIVANTAPVMIWMTDVKENCIFINKNWSDFTGMSVKDALNNGWTTVVHPDDMHATNNAFKKAHETFSPYSYELRIKRKDGKYSWILDHAVPRFSAEGEFLGYIGSSIDIEKDKNIKQQLENHVKERTIALRKSNDQLLRTNKELEQFAYVSSHDLQEPLRKIQTYSQLLSSKMENAKEEEKNYLLKINNSAHRMSCLIKDLLDFSRLSKIDEQFVDTDLNKIFKNIIDDFEVLIKQRNAKINIQNLPTIKVIPVQINQLFYNLISNAIKFSEKDPVIDICFSIPVKKDFLNYKLDASVKDKKYIKITIKDNGIGFEQKYAEQVFIIFQRLNDRKKYAGTGIGLAICKKIIENHNGFIFAESIVNKGTKFTLFLLNR